MNRFPKIRTREVGVQPQSAVPAVTPSVVGDAVATVHGESVGTNFEERVVRINTPGKALSIAAWHRGVELRMKTMGQLVPQYQRKNKPDNGGNFVENTYDRAGVMNYRLQVRPNPIMTATTFWQQVEYMRIMTGNALVYIERGSDGEPQNFWLCTGGGSYNELTGQ